jgi:membrane-associated protease RseP (regulator of RpoE activity)
MIILTIIGFILILLTTIMIHEMGHFLAAKLLGNGFLVKDLEQLIIN